MKLVKNTVSVCPTCLNTIDATISERSDGIWLSKECSAHGYCEALLDPDKYSYYKLANNGMDNGYQFIMIAITHRCNLRCNFCYISDKDKIDKPLEELKEDIRKIIREKNPGSINLSGGEPTLREDLFEIIEFIHEEFPETPIALITNGIRLADENYCRKLKDVGIDAVMFSMNGFSDDIFLATNNAKLLSVKMKALDNLKREGICTCFSITLTRDLSTKEELSKVAKYILHNLDFVSAMRIRGASKVGIFSDTKPLYMSEMIDMIAESFGKTGKDFLKGMNRKRCYHSISSFRILLFVDKKYNISYVVSGDHSKADFPKICGIIMWEAFKQRKNLFVALNKIYRLWRRGGTIRGSVSIQGDWDFIGFKVLTIKFFYWMDKYNIDLKELNAFGGFHATPSGEVLHFLEAMLETNEL